METGSIEHEANQDLVSSIKERIEAISSLKSIFRVPEKLRRSYNAHGKEMYIPDKVSIGPFHHGNEKLKDLEEHKWHYLYTLLSRKPNLEAKLHECVKALKDIEQTARHCYEEKLDLMTSNKFVEIMLLDGCFIIELFLKYSYKGLRRRGDPIFTERGLFFTVRCNLVLLENQIPWMVLQSLFVIVPIPIRCTLSELAVRFFRTMLPGEKEFLAQKFSQEGNHLLDIIHQCYIPTYLEVESKKPEASKDLECATKLQKDGIKFMKYTARSLLDISFSDGVFEIPPLVTKKFTEVLFANLIALEHHHSDQIQYFTSYALLMKAFIHCKKDAKLFAHLRIVVNEDEGMQDLEKECCALLCRLTEDVDVKGFYYAGHVEQVKEYIKRRKSWRRTAKCGCLNGLLVLNSTAHSVEAFFM